jgi:FkbM family methyltransferase
MRNIPAEMIDAPALSSESALGRLARFPLRLVPPAMVVPVLTGKLRGRRWIAGSAIHRCWLGLYEREKQELISQEVSRNTVFYDVGANVGFYSLLASALVGLGRVFAFEPAPRNLGYLRKHLELNSATNVEVLELAVSDKNGVTRFHVEPSGLMGHLSSDGAIRVPTATLDSLVVEGRILPPDYIKMDIEGAELLALHGATETVQRYRPVIFLATHSPEVHVECSRLLESWGYECTVLNGQSSEIVARSKFQQ